MSRWYVLIACALLAGCASYTPPEVRLVGLAPLESTLLEPRMRLDFSLLNTSRKALAIRGVDLALEINGVELARGVDGHGFELPAFGETRASVEVSASVFKLIQLLLTLPQAEDFSYELSGKLHLDAFPRSLPLRRAGSITREQLQGLAGGNGDRPGSLRLD